MAWQVAFTGSLVVVPDISVATAPGEKIVTRFGAHLTALSELQLSARVEVQLRPFSQQLHTLLRPTPPFGMARLLGSSIFTLVCTASRALLLPRPCLL